MPSQSYVPNDDWEKFTVPNGVKVLEFVIRGGGSGETEGGYVYGKMRVEPRDVLFVRAGRRGFPNSGNTGGEAAPGGGGAGGNGSGTGDGGYGGGGASVVRANARDGRIRVVAGGAGGRGSGAEAFGGQGGAAVGEGGKVGTDGTEPVEGATGGTPSQPGQGGTTSLGTTLYGRDGQNERAGNGGKGGTSTATDVHGGGGGGGGYYPGGGGAAGHPGIAPATGGGGGSNFVGGLYSSTNLQGGGGVDNGSIVIRWVDPNTPNQAPVPPQRITIEGKPIASGLATKAKGSVLLKGTPDDPEAKQGVRLYVKMSRNEQFTRHSVHRGTYDDTEERDHVRITGLSQDTRYYLRIHTQDQHGRISSNYRATNFWTNRSPAPPELISPFENTTFTSLVNVTFVWNHVDPDPSDSPTAFRLQWRTAATPLTEAGAWTMVEQVTAFEQWTVGAGTFLGNTLYEWQVRTRDEQERWGPWSSTSSFYVTAETTAPQIIYPIGEEAVTGTLTVALKWRFRSPHTGTLQQRADVRYRAVGAPDWTVVAGDSTTPGSEWVWEFPPNTFEIGTRYEWQVRTYGIGDAEGSDWSESAIFWSVAAPESGPGTEVIPSGRPQQPLGEGVNRAYIFQRGGLVMLGELTPTGMVRWGRKRDDISGATVTTHSWDSEQRKFLASLRTWQMELVIFRDGVRVFEGPITRISSTSDSMEIEAKCVLAYVYRRAMRQGYNDSFRIMNGQQLGQRTVVERSAQIIMNCLAYDDPNVLQYLTPLHGVDDARTSRIVKDYASTAWGEIDDLAATAGLDYVTAGRRILLWDTHNPVGRLPEMRDGDFSDSPVVTEYGMSAANHFAVTDNDGTYGTASRTGPDGDPGPEGWIEQVASAYSESEALGTDRELTREDTLRLQETFAAQADRNIEGRWPPPLVVRVPDNSTLNPALNIGINQLIPGVWVPLRCVNTVREVSQWQKLDSMEVNQTPAGEKISVVMSPAPRGGLDPDAEVLEDA
jgi:hypothetical protein